MALQKHTIFKGATRPSMFLGVPLIPFMVVTGAYALPVVWLFVFKLFWIVLIWTLIYFGVVFLMRFVSKTDNFRLKQELMRLVKRSGKGNIAYWGAITYSPMRLKRRS